MNKSDEKSLEIIGKIFIYGLPLWIPGALYVWYRTNPETFKLIFEPIYSVAIQWIQVGIKILIISLIAITLILIVRWIFNRHRERKNYEYYRLIPHTEQRIKPEAVLEMVEQIAGFQRPRYIRIFRGREWFKWMIYKDKKDIAFYVGFPRDRKTGILRTIKNAYPMAELHPAKKVPMPEKKSYSGRMKLDYKGIHEVKPLATFTGSNGIGNLVSFMGENTWIDITFSPKSPWKLRQRLRKAQKSMRKQHKRLSEMDFSERADYQSITKRLNGKDKVYSVAISVVSEDKQAGGVVQSIGTNLSSIMNDENGISLRRYPNPIEYSPYPSGFTMDWVGRELANLLLLPPSSHDIFQAIPNLKKGERALEPNEMAKGISIGRMRHPIIKNRPVKIPYNVFTQHFFSSGKTGSGKSSLILEILQSMIDEWASKPKKAAGFTLFDPARETALTVLSRIHKAEVDGAEIDWDKVHYVQIVNDKYPLAFNLLHVNEGEDHNTVKNNVFKIIDTAFSNEGAPKMKKWIGFAIDTLLQDKEKHTILGVMRMMNDYEFRRKIVDRIKDPILKKEWESFDDSVKESTFDAIGTRMAPFQSTQYMRRMFGQKDFGLNIRKWMDEGHIVLIDMLHVDDVNIAMTVGHMVTQYHQTAIRRPSKSKLHMVIVDEAHLAPIPIMDTIIAFDRKFGLGLGIVTQFLNQLPKWLKEAIKGNMGTILSGTQGDESAQQIESMTNGKFSASYVQDLPSNTVATYTKEKLENGEEKHITCTVETSPPFVYKENGEVANYNDPKEMADTFKWLESIAEKLQKRDGKDAEKVDKEVLEYLGIETEKATEKGIFDMNPLSGGEADNQENEESEGNNLGNRLSSPLPAESDIINSDESYSSRINSEESEKNQAKERSEEKIVSFFGS